MTEALKHAQDAVLAHLKPTEVAEPGEGALDFPAFAVATQRATVVEEKFDAPAAMRTNQTIPRCKSFKRSGSLS